jgi:hypothetical protein
MWDEGMLLFLLDGKRVVFQVAGGKGQGAEGQGAENRTLRFTQE